jgi:hypothetical protein
LSVAGGATESVGDDSNPGGLSVAANSVSGISVAGISVAGISVAGISVSGGFGFEAGPS